MARIPSWAAFISTEYNYIRDLQRRRLDISSLPSASTPTSNILRRQYQRPEWRRTAGFRAKAVDCTVSPKRRFCSLFADILQTS